VIPFSQSFGLLTEEENLGWRSRRFAVVVSPGSEVYWIGFEDDSAAEHVLEKVNEMLAV